MNKKKVIGIAGVIVFAVLLNVYVIKIANQRVGDLVSFCVELEASQENDYQIFEGWENWNPAQSQTVAYRRKNNAVDNSEK